MLNKKKNNKGFTLVELLVVIAIIGILAVVAVPALFKNINKAKVADLESDYSAIKSAVLSYYTDENTMPISDVTGASNGKTWNEKLADHMDSVPTDSPLNGTYNLDLVGTKLYLSISGANITQEQLTKLTQDIGIGKVFVKAVQNPEQISVSSSSTQQLEKVYTEVTLGDGGNISTLAGENVTIGLVLIENTDM